MASSLRLSRLFSHHPFKLCCYNFICRYKLRYTSDITVNEEMPAGSKEINTTVSSLRTDRIIAIGLNVPRRLIWEIFMDGRVMLNGRKVKKSAIVKEGDVIDVDTVQEFKSKEYEQPGLKTSNSGVDEDVGSEEFRRGRVVIKKIGEQTKKGRWHVTLQRHKHLATIIK